MKNITFKYTYKVHTVQMSQYMMKRTLISLEYDKQMFKLSRDGGTRILLLNVECIYGSLIH